MCDQILDFLEHHLSEFTHHFESSEERLELERLHTEYCNALRNEEFQNEQLRVLIAQLNLLEEVAGGSGESGVVTPAPVAAAGVHSGGAAGSGGGGGGDGIEARRNEWRWRLPSVTAVAGLAALVPHFISGVTPTMEAKAAAKAQDAALAADCVAELLRQYPSVAAAEAGLKLDIGERYNARLAARRRKASATGLLRTIISALQLRAMAAGEVRSCAAPRGRVAAAATAANPVDHGLATYSDAQLLSIIRRRR